MCIYIYIYYNIHISHTHTHIYIHSTYDIEVFNIEYWLVVFTYFCFKPGTGMTKPFWTHFRCFLSGNHQGGTSKIHRFKSRFGGFLSHRGTPKSSISNDGICMDFPFCSQSILGYPHSRTPPCS